MTRSLTVSHPKIFFDKIAYLYKNYYVPFAREKNEGVKTSLLIACGRSETGQWHGRGGGGRGSCMDLFALRSLLSCIEKS